MPTMTLTAGTSQAAEVAEAFGEILGTVDAQGVPRNATLKEVEGWIRAQVVTEVRRYKERKRAAVVDVVLT